MADKDEGEKKVEKAKSVEESNARGELFDEKEEEEAGEEEEGQGDADASEAADEGSESDVKQTLTALQKRLQEQDVTIAGLKGVLEERREGTRKGSSDKDEDEDEDTESDGDFENRLRTAPARTLKDMVRKTEERVIKRLQKGLKEQTQQTSQFERAVASDRMKALTDFPELNTDPEFNRDATTEYERRVQARGYVVPGDLVDAAAYVFAQRARKGKVSSVREKVRNIQDPLVRGKRATENGERSDAEPLGDLPRDLQAVAKKACKDLGISAKTWRKNWDDLKEEDQAYGS